LLRSHLTPPSGLGMVAHSHSPRVSATDQGDQPSTQPVGAAPNLAGADVVISGHDHDYERFGPQTPSGSPDSGRGIREFVVGTGGKGLLAFLHNPPYSQVRDNTTFGVLLLMLYADHYEWHFVPTQR